jgi:hypothetical protein
MLSAKRFLILLVSLFLASPPITAQEPQSAATISKEAAIIIEQSRVRFTAQKPGQEMRLQVHDQTGELVYDSGATLEPEIQWLLQNGAGEELKNGLYAYTLTIRETGAETTRMRRGHFIVDRVKGRDGADKLWVTSQSDAGVGAELTVARDETATVAGATIGERTLGQGFGISRDGGREVQPAAQSQNDAEKKALESAPSGTVGRIAKFTSATGLGDSVITEVNGSIGIGTTTPTTARLTLEGQDAMAIRGYEPGFTLIDTNHGNARGAIQQVNGGLNLFTDRYLRGADPFGFMRFDGTGNLGIGIATPGSKLDVVSGSGDIVRLNGYEPFITLYDSNHGWARGVIQQVNGGLNLFTDAYLRNVNPHGYMRLDTTGRLGVGVAFPYAKLQVEDVGPVELAINSANDRAVLALGNTLSAGRYVWTLESGVRGIPGMFGIYNRVVNRSGLEIDGNLNVYVKALQITGGADLSEKFDVAAEKDESDIEPGMVVAIDAKNPGKLQVSRRAYDRRVAGVISGAGGVQPGMTLGQEGTLADGKHPVALSGRVYVRVDASYGAIKPGDLLTSSPTPGHAMKASISAKAQGAIIGKAMTGLNSGKALVLALITLQ